MSRISVAADRFRRSILTHEEESATVLIQRYGEAYQQLAFDLNALTNQILKTFIEGKPVSRDALFRQTRLAELMQQTERAIEEFAVYAEPKVALEQAYAVERAGGHARALIATALGPGPDGINPANFMTFNAAAVEAFIGRSSDGSPLRKLFASLTKEPVEAIENVFVKGLIAGRNPRELARELKREFQVPLHRAMTISRTEVLQSYREANREYFHQNTRIVTRWRWQAAFQSRTCAMCLAMDGREFETEVKMGTHPNCRCVLVPVTKTWEELGFEGVRDRRSRAQLTGEEWFARQPEAVQLEILGRSKLERYKEGKLTLTQCVGYRRDRAWGEVRFERSLIQIDTKKRRPTRASMGIMPA